MAAKQYRAAGYPVSVAQAKRAIPISAIDMPAQVSPARSWYLNDASMPTDRGPEAESYRIAQGNCRAKSCVRK
jgi:hypothetical protein